MSMTELIDQLAALAGIEPAYYDIWGRQHVASTEVKQSLLTAMGVACADAAQAQASLEAWQAARWHALLPPVWVHTLGTGPLELILRLPERFWRAELVWRLSREDGDEMEGHTPVGGLAVCEQAELADGAYRALGLGLPEPPEGYHRLSVWIAGEGPWQMPLIVCPPQCHVPPELAAGRRLWGLAVQLYGLRSRRNWGMGDFTDLARLAAWAGREGAALIGVNPLHALRPHDPSHCSPYSPSSRQFLNTLYIDVEAVPDYAECDEVRARVAEPAFQARLAQLRASPLVDYAGVAALKYPLLEGLYRHFRQRHLAHYSPRAQAFRRFVAAGGEALHRFALYEALQAHLHAQDGQAWGWPVWPQPWREPDGPQVQAWAQAHAEAVEYRMYLQWLAHEQLGAAAAAAREAGMAVGLYLDLAVGVERGGAETWAQRGLYAFEAGIGAPPDDFNLHGQDWGLPPPNPQRLQAAGYAPFIATLRANMQAAGALRIDHVMALMRLYWVPPGLPADAGVYVRYPLADLAGLLALESRRARCLVIGEDLGTVPDEVRAAMHARAILAYRLFYFEKRWEGDRSFKPPHEIGQGALTAASTHDLPTLNGFWLGRDLVWRERLGLFPSDELRRRLSDERAADRARLLAALAAEGLLPPGVGLNPDEVPELTHPLRLAVHRYLARSPAPILLIQAEDILGEEEQANLPGTVDAHPNWRRKLSLDLEDWGQDARFRETLQALAAERG
ncbi:MAG: 4-alpha-glucanotransferase [Thiobacillaceae bacterium]|nr:4-alpha-glucanotransferase [Thiobacillaceae bacterium]MDW8323975.1 4-alpha-glucanotransferase [Burkholderiales bacterium]